MTNRIPLLERVPPDYHRLYLFFGENDFRGMICVDGEQCLHIGITKQPHPKTVGNYMDWQQETVEQIRSELQSLNQAV